MRHKRMRHSQKLLILLMIIVTIFLILPILKAPNLRIFMSSARFNTPSIPKNPVMIQQTMPTTFVLIVKSHDPLLLTRLQQQGWPAYMADDQINIGPYLTSFKSQLNLSALGNVGYTLKNQ